MFNGYETEELVADHVAALLRELDLAVRAGDGPRSDAIRKELRKFGAKAQTPAEQAEKRPVGRPRKNPEVESRA